MNTKGAIQVLRNQILDYAKMIDKLYFFLPNSPKNKQSLAKTFVA